MTRLIELIKVYQSLGYPPQEAAKLAFIDFENEREERRHQEEREERQHEIERQERQRQEERQREIERQERQRQEERQREIERQERHQKEERERQEDRQRQEERQREIAREVVQEREFRFGERIRNYIKLRDPFPSVLIQKFMTSVSEGGTIHASSIVSNSDPGWKETLRVWFSQSIADPVRFTFELPSLPVPPGFSRDILHYQHDIESLDLRLWDIQSRTGETASILLEDSNGLQMRLSGRADFVISTNRATCRQAAYQFSVCIIEFQSKDSEEDCEYQLMTYLVILMHQFQMENLLGILIYKDGRCRAYRATSSEGGVIYEQEDIFYLCHIGPVLQTLLSLPD